MHRDIKPENLVFDKDGFLYLTDMGIAKLVRSDKTIIDSSGTPGYMAPEVIGNGNHDTVSDYFAVGVIAYEFMFQRVNIFKLKVEAVPRQDKEGDKGANVRKGRKY
jgi:protein kinase A